MPTMSSRVAVAVHVLALLTWRRGEAVSSQQIARSVNTNPVVVRRIVGALRNAGLVSVQAGAAGGAQLARDPGEITLLDVYRAVEAADGLFPLPLHPPSQHCDVGANIQGALVTVFDRAEAAMEAVLAGVTLGDVWRTVFSRMQHRCGCEGGPE